MKILGIELPFFGNTKKEEVKRDNVVFESCSVDNSSELDITTSSDNKHGNIMYEKNGIKVRDMTDIIDPDDDDRDMFWKYFPHWKGKNCYEMDNYHFQGYFHLWGDKDDIYHGFKKYGMYPKDFAVVISHENTAKKIICPRDVPAVLYMPMNGEKVKTVTFPDGLNDDIVLFGIKPVDSKGREIYYNKNNSSFLKFPSKYDLIKAMFGDNQRVENKDIKKYILSLDVIGENHFYFYYSTSASKEVRDNINNFKNTFYELKTKNTFTKKIYPTVPDMVSGGSFDWEKAYKDAENGVDRPIFNGFSFFTQLAEINTKFANFWKSELQRVKFFEKYGLDEWDYTYHRNGGGMKKYVYVTAKSIEYDSSSSATDECIWHKTLNELEKYYNGDIPQKYVCSFANNKEQERENKKNLNDNEFFSLVTNIILDREDNEIISFINCNSTKTILSQLRRDTDFTFVKMPVIDSQNEEINKVMKKTILDLIYHSLKNENEKGFVRKTHVKFL